MLLDPISAIPSVNRISLTDVHKQYVFENVCYGVDNLKYSIEERQFPAQKTLDLLYTLLTVSKLNMMKNMTVFLVSDVLLFLLAEFLKP